MTEASKQVKSKVWKRHLDTSPASPNGKKIPRALAQMLIPEVHRYLFAKYFKGFKVTDFKQDFKNPNNVFITLEKQWNSKVFVADVKMFDHVQAIVNSMKIEDLQDFMNQGVFRSDPHKFATNHGNTHLEAFVSVNTAEMDKTKCSV